MHTSTKENDMKEKKFKTTLKCSGCVDKVAPFLDEAVGLGNWAVDLDKPVKILTISGDDIDASKVIHALEKGGYKAEEL